MDETPYLLPKIDAVGIDIWTMSKGLMFDNILIATDETLAAAFADQSFKLRKEIEDLQQPKPDKGAGGGVLEMITGNPVPVAVTTIVVLITTIWCCCLRTGDVPPPPSEAERKKHQEARQKRSKAAQSEKDASSGEKDAGATGQDSTEKKPEAEGGLGDISADDS